MDYLMSIGVNNRNKILIMILMRSTGTTGSTCQRMCIQVLVGRKTGKDQALLNPLTVRKAFVVSNSPAVTEYLLGLDAHFSGQCLYAFVFLNDDLAFFKLFHGDLRMKDFVQRVE